ncbi:divalent metal cation transporter [Longimicrobium sp.]|uniref:NRAMP family divalent metal transporter n=1 Tax=Longimicrobium sp. TaxID=2029185 RepID=UPI002C2273E1|nr:divalent metal cation transporter [Longimicrobium sp.]HSU14924.1 divalent metal cation transporter [Longimicrobium sp.]
MARPKKKLRERRRKPRHERRRRPSRHQPGSHAAERGREGLLRSLGLGLITGAADDDPSAIGTYASAGARLGPSFLWTAPATLPMMYAVVYLSAKLGQVTGQGLFAVIQRRFPRWVLYPSLVAVLIGNTIEAGADIAGMAAAVGLLVKVPAGVIVVFITAAVLALQVWGSYTLIRNVFRWLALALLAYIVAAILARPELMPVLRGTFIPTLRFDREFLSLLVAVIGTTLSAYLYTWQSNEEVEEQIATGLRRLSDRRGTTDAELRRTRKDILFGMCFSNLVMYFIVLSTSATLYRAGQHDVESAADAARALQPLAGSAAGVLFALGVIGVGFLAVPIMTTGAAYDLAQTLGWKHGLHTRPREAKKFYAAIAGFTLLAMGMNFLGFNPMKALVFAGIVQGFSTPPLMLLIMLMTNNREIMGERVNGRAMNVLGWTTTAVIFAATGALIVTWVM